MNSPMPLFPLSLFRHAIPPRIFCFTVPVTSIPLYHDHHLNALSLAECRLGRNLSVGARQARRRNIMISAATPPKGVTQPPTKPVVPAAKFGFVENAEVLNSRAAMVSVKFFLVSFCMHS